MKRFAKAAALACLGMVIGGSGDLRAQRFEISVSPSVRSTPVTGRLMLLVSKTGMPEPIFQMTMYGAATYGVDLEELPAGRAVVIDRNTYGYPMALNELPAGEYWVQPIINVYTRVTRADGHTIWVPFNDGRNLGVSRQGGNLYGEAQRVRLGGGRTPTVRLTVTRAITSPPKPSDTQWIKNVRIQSQKLTRFWGRPVYIHARVLLPRGYDEHPNARYPLIFTLGHGNPFRFSTDSTQGLRVDPVSGLETGYSFYRSWISDSFPRVIAVSLEQATPYFVDSYSVNSANNGPYGDAFVEEIVPELERRFRAIGKPYARHLEGASTSGWQVLALQLRNPDYFGGAWVLNPDPIDFTRYGLVNIYEDSNAFAQPSGQFTMQERPYRRTADGQVRTTNREGSRYEEAKGSRGRSGSQLHAWEAVYGPVDAHGYPKPLWNKRTGVIDRSVAEYMRDNGYDLRVYAERNWSRIGPRLAGKLHFFQGDMDWFYLNLAVYEMEAFLRSTTNPKSDADFTYGRPMKGHSWHAWTWAEFVRIVADNVRKNAPAGENVQSWNY